MNKNELNEYIKKAEEGDVNSQLILGLTYLKGDDEIPASLSLAGISSSPFK